MCKAHNCFVGHSYGWSVACALESPLLLKSTCSSSFVFKNHKSFPLTAHSMRGETLALHLTNPLHSPVLQGAQVPARGCAAPKRVTFIGISYGTASNRLLFFFQGSLSKGEAQQGSKPKHEKGSLPTYFKYTIPHK